MNKALAGLLFTLTLYGNAAEAAGGNITGMVGFRQVDQDQWEPTDTQGLIGILGDFSVWDFPLHIEFGLAGSSDEDDFFDGERVDVEQRIGQFTAGIVLIPDYGPMRPYFATGVAAVNLEAEVDDSQGHDTDEDSSLGAYIGGGILWRTMPNLVLGFDGRYLGGTDMRVFGNKVDVDGFTVAFRIGYGWDWSHRDYEREPPRRPPPRRPRRY
jgi:opacity protein-like surface antigen